MSDPRDTSSLDTTLVTDVALEENLDEALSICIDEGRCEPLADLLRNNRRGRDLTRDIMDRQLWHRFCKLSPADVALIVARLTPPILAVPSSQRSLLFQWLHRIASRVLALQPAETEHGSNSRTIGNDTGDKWAGSPAAAARTLGAPASDLKQTAVRAVLECAHHQEFKRARQTAKLLSVQASDFRPPERSSMRNALEIGLGTRSTAGAAVRLALEWPEFVGAQVAAPLPGQLLNWNLLDAAVAWALTRPSRERDAFLRRTATACGPAAVLGALHRGPAPREALPETLLEDLETERLQKMVAKGGWPVVQRRAAGMEFRAKLVLLETLFVLGQDQELRAAAGQWGMLDWKPGSAALAERERAARERIRLFEDASGREAAGSLTWVDTEAGLEKVVSWLQTEVEAAENVADAAERGSDRHIFIGGGCAMGIVGLDTECRPARRPGEHQDVSVLQLSSMDTAYVLDAARLRDAPGMRRVARLLGSGSLLIAGVGVVQDWNKLRATVPAFAAEGPHPAAVDLGRVWKAFKQRFNDLQGGEEAQRQVQHAAPGLASLARLFLGRQLDKACCMSDWSARPLSQKQIDYAATDAWVALAILQEMAEAVPDLSFSDGLLGGKTPAMAGVFPSVPGIVRIGRGLESFPGIC